jgi:hypothetical protein
MLHAAFDFFQGHLPQILNRTGAFGESKEQRTYH